MGTKPVGIVFVPPLLMLILAAQLWKRPALKAMAAATGLMLGCLFLSTGFWFVRNCRITGNPLYPLHLELFGTSLLTGWYGRDAMRFSVYYLPMSDGGALVDMLMALLDPRLALLWIAALAGAWAIGSCGSKQQDRLTWALAVLAVLNVALYWICIPYRTQQRFMLQSLGLAAIPLSRLLDRGRWLRLTAAGLLGLHLLTPQAWPVAAEDSGIPWDLSRYVPNAVGPPLPLATRLARVLAPGWDSRAVVGILLPLGMASLSLLAAWAGGRWTASRGDRAQVSHWPWPVLRALPRSGHWRPAHPCSIPGSASIRRFATSTPAGWNWRAVRDQRGRGWRTRGPTSLTISSGPGCGTRCDTSTSTPTQDG